jgi:hypothetical protein
VVEIVQDVSTVVLSCGNGASSDEAVGVFTEGIEKGEHWYIALLRAIGMWDNVEEIYQGNNYHYLIAGEAFDWLLLAERLCSELGDLLPDAEKTDLLFRGKPPIDLTPGEFRDLIGNQKYRQYLNFFYGITVEDALFLVVQDEVRKEQRTLGFNREVDVVNEVYRRLYGAAKWILLRRFRTDNGYPNVRSISLGELKEFSYWRFKLRLKHCDKVRIASDTKKALQRLHDDGFPRGLINARYGNLDCY